MPIRVHNPTSPGRRKSSVDSFDDITKSEPEKSLIFIKKKNSGRNSGGKITVRHRGGGTKRYMREVDFLRDEFDMPAKVSAIEYDPNRTARIALLEYSDGEKRYIVAPLGLSVGDEIVSSKNKAEIKVGNRMPIENIPVGTIVHNIELQPGMGGILVRSAGLGAQLLAVEGQYAQLKMPSKEVRVVKKECMATIGEVGAKDKRLIRWGKAGRMRYRGWRPTVRGKAMNPVDHPHGGGEGLSPIGLKYPKTKWGRHALGVKTRKANKWSNKFIIKRRK
ncbi:50S ribosomal protein L2 [Candidatus Falkowbacteria bacterium]|nr:50S ribosomal protein L2 [Candidatus Falkowbacteria bacterium]